MIDIKKIEKKVNDLLEKESDENLKLWLTEKRIKELERIFSGWGDWDNPELDVYNED